LLIYDRILFYRSFFAASSRLSAGVTNTIGGN
jgi:hypothetical protein